MENLVDITCRKCNYVFNYKIIPGITNLRSVIIVCPRCKESYAINKHSYEQIIKEESIAAFNGDFDEDYQFIRLLCALIQKMSTEELKVYFNLEKIDYNDEKHKELWDSYNESQRKELIDLELIQSIKFNVSIKSIFDKFIK